MLKVRAFVYSILYVLQLASTEYQYETKYLDVPVDHFSFGNDVTFKLRYLVNDSFWELPDGPIFFYTGNEGDISVFAQNTGFLWETAIKFKALIVFAEHRYYGTSLPFGNLSLTGPKYFGYLSSQQAMADFVDVIDHVRTNKKRVGAKNGVFERENEWKTTKQNVKNRKKVTNPVIAFGGSYGGMLAAWIRIKYPAFVEGSLASSAPVWGFSGMTSCHYFPRILTAVFEMYDKNCAINVKNSWAALDKITSTENGKSWLLKEWKLCSPINNSTDLKKLKDFVSEIYGDMGMINYPYPTSFLNPVPAYPVKEFCGKISEIYANETELLSKLSDGLSIFLNFTGQSKCVSWNQSPTPGLGMDAWGIQSCSELVLPMCSDGISDMLDNAPWNFTAYSDDCFSKYSIKPRLDYAYKAYGGKDLNAASNIIFSNGLLDPWSGGGVLTNASGKTVTVVIPESAHHLDLRSANASDPSAVIKARLLYEKLFRKWILAYYRRNKIENEEYEKHLLSVIQNVNV